jgi:ligand-binding sensor protein/AraC-like DNA-binding protein
MANIPNLDHIINAQNFQKIQDSLAEATDMAMVTVDFQGVPVTRHSRCSDYCTLVRSVPELEDACRKCDSRGGIEASRLGEPYIYRCHRGIVDLAVPIILEGRYTGAALAGQVLLKDDDDDLEKIAESPRVDAETERKLEELREKLPAMTRDRIQVIANMFFRITNYIIEEALVKMSLSESIDAERDAPMNGEKTPALTGEQRAADSPILAPALAYIAENCHKRLTIDDMASFCNISSSYFSKLFNRTAGKTFSNYVNGLRVERAKKLLETTDTPITAIAFDLGFDDSGYFDKVFKRIEGVTPSAYKACLRGGPC